MRFLLAGSLLAGIMLIGSGCDEQPQEPAAPPPADPEPMPDGAEPGGYPPPGDGAQLMPRPGESFAPGVADRGQPSSPPLAEGPAAGEFLSGQPSDRVSSLESDLTDELVSGGSDFARPLAVEDPEQLEVEQPIDFGESSDGFGQLGGRYGPAEIEGEADASASDEIGSEGAP